MLIALLKACLMADLLFGRVDGMLLDERREEGSRWGSDVSPLATCFACSSACSLPGIPIWPAV